MTPFGERGAADPGLATTGRSSGAGRREPRLGALGAVATVRDGAAAPLARELATDYAGLPNLSTLKLRVFREVVERQSLTAAAQVLYVTQPVVSAHVRSLEEVFGTRLLVRQGRRMVPTQAGRVLFNHACATLEATQRVTDQLGSYRLARRGELRVGADNTTGMHLMTPLVLGFLKSHPEVEIAVHVSDHATVENAVQGGVFDFGYITNVALPLPPALTFECVGRDTLVLVARPDHPWARRGRVSLAELDEAEFVAAARGTPRRLWEERWLEQRGVQRRVRLSGATTEMCKQAVLAGFGVALLFHSGVAHDLTSGALAAVALTDEPWPWVERGVIYRRALVLTPLQEAFLAHCRAAATERAAPP